MKHRSERLNVLIKEAISDLVLRELEFDGALVTVTGVKISEDNAYADIGVSVIPSTQAKSVLKTLKENAGHLQYLLIRKLSMRAIPYIRFEYDKGPEKAQRVEKILLEEEAREGTDSE